jgi:argininosuccinate lyase
MSSKLWGGRFTGKTDPLMEKFQDSISFDQRLWRVDIDGSKAYAQTIADAGLITADEARQIIAGLEQVAQEWEEGKFVLQPGDEDIHTANERRLTQLVGAVAGKLHTGRSRNDQIATDTRLWLRSEIATLRVHLLALIEVAVARAEAEMEYILPGYTHLQPAQPVRWSHWLLSHAFAWQRDAERLDDLTRRVNVMPLGNGALAGNPFPIDRYKLAERLGFDAITDNSLDGVSDRDFIAEFLFWGAMTMLHLSRWAEDLIIYSSREFGYVSLADAYSTGSSLMPQKKNPDALELLRGKSSRVMGGLTALMTLLKGLPSTYNKDLQEDKEPLFDAVNNLDGSLQIASGVLSTLSVNPVAMMAALAPEMLATDLADYLVRRGIPFRDAHHVAGAAVRMAEVQGVSLFDLELDDLRTLHDAFNEDVADVWSFEGSVEQRDVAGGTSQRAVREQIATLTKWLAVKRSV